MMRYREIGKRTCRCNCVSSFRNCFNFIFQVASEEN
jgi:hypothetical protein